MTLEQAKQIIAANYAMQENTLCYLLHEECRFSINAFWEFYDAISCVTKACAKSEDLTKHIAVGYQQFLKEIIYHFAPNDVAVMDDFPENYNEYIERLDFAVRAYLENESEQLDDALHEQQEKG